MPDADKKTQKQRDQFLAFAFASADLFIEVSQKGKIQFALGASKGLTGLSDVEMMDKNWLDIFSDYDRPTLKQLQEDSKAGKRWGPALIDLNEEFSKRKGIITGIKMPNSDVTYITLGLSNALMGKLAAAPKTKHKDLADVSTFVDETTQALDFARSLGEDADITLFDFGFTQALEDEFDPNDWAALQDDIKDFLQDHGLNNANPGKFSPSQFALTHSKEIDAETLKTQLTKIVEEHLPDGTTGYVPDALTIAADLSEVSAWGAEKAVDYIVTGFTAKDEPLKDMEIKTISQGLKKLGSENKSKIEILKDIIDRVDFSLKFTPTMTIADESVLHYEIIPQFPTGTQREWMMLIEDSNLTEEFDLAFCERAVNHVIFKTGGSRTKFSASIFVQSLKLSSFIDKLQPYLDKGKEQNLNERLSFGIRQSEQLKNNNEAMLAIKKLRKQDYDVILNDASLSPQTMTNISNLNINTINIAAKHTRDIHTDERQASSVERLQTLCRKKGIDLQASDITNDKQATILKDIGIKYGQGPLYGEQQDTTNYQPPEK